MSGKRMKEPKKNKKIGLLLITFLAIVIVSMTLWQGDYQLGDLKDKIQKSMFDEGNEVENTIASNTVDGTGLSESGGTNDSNGATIFSDVEKNNSLNNINSDGASVETNWTSTPQIASGNNFTVVLKEDGTVWTWGNNQYGQLGKGTTSNTTFKEPQQVVGVGGEGHLEHVKQISAGESYAMALMEDGKVVTWGYNNVGQLGNNSTNNSPVPTYVIMDNFGWITELSQIKQIAAGSSHGLALNESGEVYAWGLNNNGQLGKLVFSNDSKSDDYKNLTAIPVFYEQRRFSYIYSIF